MKKYFVALGWLVAYAVGLVGGVGYAAYLDGYIFQKVVETIAQPCY